LTDEWRINKVTCLANARRRLNTAFYRAVLVSIALVYLLHASEQAYAQGRLCCSNALNDNSKRGDLVEQVPDHYLKRYNRWKATFLSVALGRDLWAKYAENPDFHLTIIVSKNQDKGAKVQDYKWENGKLAAATMILGGQLNSGFPGQTYYPVLGSLAFTRYPWEDRSDFILAAAKIAHEFGHIDQTAHSDANDYQEQDELLDDYVTQFKSNGYDPNDPVLKRLAGMMGGIPEEIHGQREYWAETYAMRFLNDKLSSWEHRQLLKVIRKAMQSSESAIYSQPSQKEWSDLVPPECEANAPNCREDKH
jgi:hypothetical protein